MKFASLILEIQVSTAEYGLFLLFLFLGAVLTLRSLRVFCLHIIGAGREYWINNQIQM